MTGWAVNWLAFTLIVVVPLTIIIGMAAVLIHDHIKRKRRDKRCHQRILNWWELKAE